MWLLSDGAIDCDTIVHVFLLDVSCKGVLIRHAKELGLIEVSAITFGCKC